MSVMINLMTIIICSVITFTSCSVDEKNNLSGRFSEDDLDRVIDGDDSDEDKIQKDDDVWQYSKDLQEQTDNKHVCDKNVSDEVVKEEVFEASETVQQVIIENVLEVEKLDDYLLQNNAFSPMQGSIDYVSERIIADKISQDSDLLSKMISQKGLLVIYRMLFQTDLTENQKEALEFLEKALANKVDRLYKIFTLDEDEIRNMLDIMSVNLNKIREFVSSNELVLELDASGDEEVAVKSDGEVRVEYTEVKRGLEGEIDPSLDDYSFMINAYFNDHDDIRSIVESINSIEIVVP
ncbi:hypothetical protein [Borrelia persica]|uniref:hypothetical protein n=1 Tax=Borrelia persica TaxID=44448 RepID=UPI0004642B80|nr:hypothetical protein [Borrelia persica]